MKLWKGLFYCMWMCDKPVIQEELADQISDMAHCFRRPEEGKGQRSNCCPSARRLLVREHATKQISNNHCQGFDCTVCKCPIIF